MSVSLLKLELLFSESAVDADQVYLGECSNNIVVSVVVNLGLMRHDL